MGNLPENFVGGKISRFYHNWQQLTTDRWTFNIIKGYKLEFESIPYQDNEPHLINFTEQEKTYINIEMEKLIDKNIVQRVPFYEDDR